MNKIYLILSLLLYTRIFSQVSGIIVEENTLKPLSNVNISSAKGGTVSKADGTFEIIVSEGSELIFSHIGYTELKVLAKNGMKVYLKKGALKLDEIIVKSGLVKKNFLNSTSSLTLIKGSEIRNTGADHLQDIVNRVSNLNWAGGTSRPRYFQIRGIGERSHYFGEGPPNFSIGFIMDDIDLSGLGMLGQLIDIDQIEVFRGPQSSVFGSNAIGGVISLKSGQPVNNNSYSYSLTIGNDQKKAINGFFNYKILDNMFFRVSSSYNLSNGFRKNKFLARNDSNKKDELFIRAKLFFSPIQNLSVLGTVIASDLKNGYDAWAPDNNKTFVTYADELGEDSQNTKAGSLLLNYQLSNNHIFKAISSYSTTHQVHSYDGDWANDEYWFIEHGFDPNIEGWNYSFYDSNNRVRNNFSQEFRLSFGNYTLGGFYNILKETDSAIGYLFGGLADEADSQYEIQKLAAYFQSLHKIGEKIKFDISLRIEDYYYKYKGTSIDNYYYTSIPNVTFIQNKDDRDPMLGYKMSLSYQKSYFSNLFISYAKGYKAGGANQQPLLDIRNRPFGPEFIDNFELGIKTIKDNYVFSATSFYGFRRDQQVSVSSQQELGNPNSFYFFTANSGKGTLKGFEAEFSYRFLNSWFATSSLGLLDTYVEKFSYLTSNGLSYGGGRGSAMAPRLTGSFGIKYDVKKTYFSFITTYKSDYFFSDSHDNKSDAFSLTNLSFGHIFANFNLQFWSKNIFDKKFVTRGFYFGLIPPNYSEELWESYGDPRSFGVTLIYNIK